MQKPADLSALVVDDNDYARALAITMLDRLGVGRVLEASHAADGLRLLADEQPDVVILDWYMPDINGAGFVRMARDAGHPTGIIIATAYATRENLMRIRELGISQVLVKPFDRKQLGQAILATIARHGRSGGEDAEAVFI